MSKKAKNVKTPAPAPASVPTPPPTPVKAPGKKPSKTDDERPTVESILAAQSSLLYRGGSRVTETYDVIPFGIYGLDRYVLEVGGAIRGRIYEVVGHQSCLADSTYIQFQTRTPDGRLQNAKGGTIAELFTKFHDKPRTWRKNRRDRRSDGAVFTTVSLTQSGGFRQNRILDVVDAGIQECFELKTARGHSITATAMHRFRVDDGFVRLESLRVGDAVWLHENTHRTSDTPKPLPTGQERFTLVPTKDQITSITPVGPRQTYDLCMEAPNHNFVADRFVVHNSGKTTLCLQLVANAQARGLQVAYIDAEHALDTAWAAARGVSVEDLLIGQPDCGEDALELVDSLCNSYQVGLVVIDSVAALVPRAELKGEMGDSVPGDTPVLIRDKLTKRIEIVPIASLYGGQKTFPHPGRHSNIYRKTKMTEVYTASGWRQLTGVCYKQNYKRKSLIVTNTAAGAAITTPDHALFCDGAEVTPAEIKAGRLLDQHMPEHTERETFMPCDVAWLLGYFCAEGHARPTTDRFSLSDTTRGNIEHARAIIARLFQASTSVVTSYPEAPRVPLHTLTIGRCPELSQLFRSCVDGLTREKKVPALVLNSNKKVMSAFLAGYRAGDGDTSIDPLSFSSSSFTLTAGVAYIMHACGMPFRLHGNHRDGVKVQWNLTETTADGRVHHPREVRRQFQIPPPEYLYDLETEDGTFAGGIGMVIHHNSHMGLQARLMSQALRKLAAIVAKSKTCVVFTNQYRKGMGGTFAPENVPTGGNALKFYASVRIETTYMGKIKSGEGEDAEVIGSEVRITAVKNKTAAPWRMIKLPLLFNSGYDDVANMVDLAVSNELSCVRKLSSSMWEVFGATVRGRPAAIEAARVRADDLRAALDAFYRDGVVG